MPLQGKVTFALRRNNSEPCRLKPTPTAYVKLPPRHRVQVTPKTSHRFNELPRTRKVPESTQSTPLEFLILTCIERDTLKQLPANLVRGEAQQKLQFAWKTKRLLQPNPTTEPPSPHRPRQPLTKRRLPRGIDMKPTFNKLM